MLGARPERDRGGTGAMPGAGLERCSEWDWSISRGDVRSDARSGTGAMPGAMFGAMPAAGLERCPDPTLRGGGC